MVKYYIRIPIKQIIMYTVIYEYDLIYNNYKSKMILDIFVHYFHIHKLTFAIYSVE